VPDKLIVVHGGAAAHQYRNVMQALDDALRVGADMFEFDVRMAADGTLVVHHDAEIGAGVLRTLPYHEAAVLASSLSYHLPRVIDVLEKACGRLRLDVELKEGGYEDTVVRLLMDYRFSPRDFVVTSFEQPALDAIHNAHPAVRTGLLVYDVNPSTAFEMFYGSGAAFLGPDHQILDDATLRQALAGEIPLMPWTVNDPSNTRRLLRAPAVIGMITDHAAEAIRIRQDTHP
jgi:glycerophosphoryl diester phosphodiesterase